MQPPAPGAGVTAMDVLRDDAAPVIALYDAFRRTAQPIVCAVAGRAWGIGMVLAALADLTSPPPTAAFGCANSTAAFRPASRWRRCWTACRSRRWRISCSPPSEMDARPRWPRGVVSRLVHPAGWTRDVAALERLLSFPDAAVRAVKQYLATAPRNNEAHAALYGASLLGNVLVALKAAADTTRRQAR
jgi:enoyl-CoA hydratase/carnithine racemase